VTAFAFDTIDTFAGPGGWSVAAVVLGLRELGIELDPWACATRAAAGHLTVRADVAQLPLHRMAGKFKGLIASPPCGTFSAAGKGEGVDDLPLIHQTLDDLAAGNDTRAQLAAACSDPRTPLVVEPLRYALALRPEWIALEQVPSVLPLWKHIARILRARGYSAWAGLLNAADFGVPQTRKRAILIASRIRTVAPPEPTHAKVAEPPSLFGPGREHWVSMAEALGWAGPLAARVDNTRGERTTPGGNEFSPSGPSWALTEKTRSWVVRTSFGRPTRGAHEVDPFASPCHAVTGKARSWVLRSNTQDNAAVRTLDEPASTLFFGARGNDVSWVLRAGPQENATTRGMDEAAPTLFFGHQADGVACQATPSDADPIRISVQEAAVLQPFPADYPWQGTKTQQFLQCGNAWCPRAAMAVLGAAAGIDWQPVVDRYYGTAHEVSA
jgi:DNA (cytosine-5)-methyltransferase 1